MTKNEPGEGKLSAEGRDPNLNIDEFNDAGFRVEETGNSHPVITGSTIVASQHRPHLLYVFLPVIFLTSALFGGLRVDGTDRAFIFLGPPLICLVLAAVLMILYVRGNLVRPDGWISESFGPLKNTANIAILISLFAASTQLFNSLLPEAGLPFWIVGFCFVWTLWNNLFSEFDPRRTIRSLAALFALAFAVKYLVLANLMAPAGDGWLRSMIENPGREAVTWMLDLPRFSPATGYIQFFTVVLYFAGLYFLPASTADDR